VPPFQVHHPARADPRGKVLVMGGSAGGVTEARGRTADLSRARTPWGEGTRPNHSVAAARQSDLPGTIP
jgi:hypothetical protein